MVKSIYYNDNRFASHLVTFATTVEENSGKFQGDILLTPKQEQEIFGLDRTGMVNVRYRWPGNTVPYVLSNSFDADQRAYIELGLKRIEELTCIKFVPRTNQISYVDVTVSTERNISLRIELNFFSRTIGRQWWMFLVCWIFESRKATIKYPEICSR